MKIGFKGKTKAIKITACTILFFFLFYLLIFNSNHSQAINYSNVYDYAQLPSTDINLNTIITTVDYWRSGVSYQVQVDIQFSSWTATTYDQIRINSIEIYGATGTFSVTGLNHVMSASVHPSLTENISVYYSGASDPIYLAVLVKYNLHWNGGDWLTETCCGPVGLYVNMNDAPTVSPELDVEFVENQTGYSISWDLHDSDGNLASYSITNNSIPFRSDTCSNPTSQMINVNLNGLSIGTYTFVIQVQDARGETDTDTVIVKVTDGSSSGPPAGSDTPPPIPGFEACILFIGLTCLLLIYSGIRARFNPNLSTGKG